METITVKKSLLKGKYGARNFAFIFNKGSLQVTDTFWEFFKIET